MNVKILKGNFRSIKLWMECLWGSFLSGLPRVAKSFLNALKISFREIEAPKPFISIINGSSRPGATTQMTLDEIKIGEKEEKRKKWGKLETINETEEKTNNKLLLSPKARRKLRSTFCSFLSLWFLSEATNYTSKIEKANKMSIK